MAWITGKITLVSQEHRHILKHLATFKHKSDEYISSAEKWAVRVVAWYVLEVREKLNFVFNF